jgi:hypothetical protein
VFLLVFVWFARWSHQAQSAAPGSRASPPLPQLIRALAGTIVTGYALFALIIAVFYFVLGDEPRTFVPQSLVQGVVLAFGIVFPSFVIVTNGERFARRSMRGRRSVSSSGHSRHGPRRADVDRS